MIKYIPWMPDIEVVFGKATTPKAIDIMIP